MSLPEHTKRYTVRANSFREAADSAGELGEQVEGGLFILSIQCEEKFPPSALDRLFGRGGLWEVEVRFDDLNPSPRKSRIQYVDANGDPLVS